MGKWDPRGYSLVDQLKDMTNGWDVSAGDDGSVIKIRDGAGKAFIPSSSDKLHDHYELINGEWVKV